LQGWNLSGKGLTASSTKLPEANADHGCEHQTYLDNTISKGQLTPTPTFKYPFPLNRMVQDSKQAPTLDSYRNAWNGYA